MKSSHINLAFAAVIAAASTTAHATSIDLTSFSPTYDDGAGYVPGSPPGWTDVITSNNITISNGAALGDGPHDVLYLGNNLHNFTADIDVAAATSSAFPYTFGGVFVDTSNGFFGLNFGSGSLAIEYQIDGQSAQSEDETSYTTDDVTLRLTRNNDLFTASYSTDGVNFTNVGELTGLTGTTQFDLTSYASVDGLTASFSNLKVDTISSAPESSTWGLMVVGIGAVGLVLRASNRNYGISYERRFTLKF
ncbi:MAG: DUF1349 domain-containing protein [Caulobacteraceae bacterium]